MIRVIIVFFVAMFYIATKSDAAPYYVWNDPGGLVIERMIEIKKLQKSKKQVRIMGKCMSACTLYLTLDNICRGPNAKFGFHNARGFNMEKSIKITYIMYKKYPPWVRKWIDSIGGLKMDIREMPPQYFKKYVRKC